MASAEPLKEAMMEEYFVWMLGRAQQARGPLVLSPPRITKAAMAPVARYWQRSRDQGLLATRPCVRWAGR